MPRTSTSGFLKMTVTAIHLASHASYSTPLQGALLSYDFSSVQLTREYLSEPFGEASQRDNGSILYNYALSQTTNMNAGYNYLRQAWSVPQAEVAALYCMRNLETANGRGLVGITHQLNPGDTISLSAQQTYYRYEISQDVTSTNGSVHLSRCRFTCVQPGFGERL